MPDLCRTGPSCPQIGNAVAILAPYVGHPIREVTTELVAKATLRDVDDRRRERTVCVTWQVVPKPRTGSAEKGPKRVTRMQMWIDLLAAGTDRSYCQQTLFLSSPLLIPHIYFGIIIALAVYSNPVVGPKNLSTYCLDTFCSNEKKSELKDTGWPRA